MERVFQRLSEPSHFYTVGHTEGSFVGGKYHHFDVFLAVETLKVQVAMKSLLKSFNRQVLWLKPTCVQWPGVLEGHQKIFILGCSVFVHIHKKGECANYRASFNVTSLEKCVFHPCCSIADENFFLLSKFSRKRGSMRRKSTRVLPALRKHQVFRENL